jgi:hypothetical protein
MASGEARALGDPMALESLRRALVDETSTFRGFRRRVKNKTVQQVAGLALPALVLLLFFAVYGTWSTVGADDGESGSAWDRFVGSSAMRVDAAALLVLAALRAWFVLWIRREHRWFRREGWIALQGATGWVLLTTDAPTAIVHDHRSVGGQAEHRTRDLSDPIVLASGPQASVADFERTLVTVRASVATRPYDAATLKDLYRQCGRWGSIPAEPWFAPASGCLLGQGDGGGPLAAVIPRPYKDGRRRRLARVKLTKAERQALLSAV